MTISLLIYPGHGGGRVPVTFHDMNLGVDPSLYWPRQLGL